MIICRHNSILKVSISWRSWLKRKATQQHTFLNNVIFYVAFLFILESLHCYFVIVKWRWGCFKMLKPRACAFGSHTRQTVKESIMCKQIFSGDLLSKGHSVRCNLFIDNLWQWCNEPANTTKVMNPFLF